jgi:fibronectin type 3 domain-containing protein
LKGNSQSALLGGIALLLLICIAISFRGLSRFSSLKRAATPHSAKLSWKPSTSAVKGYNIYRGTEASGSYTRINPAVVPDTSYVDSGVEAGVTYYYVTTAVTAAGVESRSSNRVVAVIPHE